jgi:hypothetical protein
MALGAVLGPGLDAGAWRRGGALRGDLTLGSLPILATAGARYAATPANGQGVSEQWIAASAGVGGAGYWNEFRAALRSELVYERARASISGARSDSASRGVAGLRVSADVAWMFARRVGVVAGADASVLGGSTLVTLRGADVGRSEALVVSMFFGVCATTF